MVNYRRKTTTLLIAINVFLFILSSFVGFLVSSNSLALDLLGGSIFQLIAHGEIWRLVTANFLHANIFHIVLNMYALYILGGVIETEYSGKALVSVYIFTAIFGSLMSFLISYFAISLGIKDPNIYVVSVGASGALFGMLGFLLVADGTMIDKQSLLNILFLNLFIGVIFSGVIDNWAHLGGALGGIILGLIDNKKGVLHQYNYLQLSFIVSNVVVFVSYIALIIFIYQKIIL